MQSLPLHRFFSSAGNWSNGVREIIRSCYHFYGLDPESYITPELEDPQEGHSVLPHDLQAPGMMSERASRLMPVSSFDKTFSPIPPRHASTPRQSREPESPVTDQLEKTISPLPQTPRRKKTRYKPCSPKQFTPLAIRRHHILDALLSVIITSKNGVNRTSKYASNCSMNHPIME